MALGGPVIRRDDGLQVTAGHQHLEIVWPASRQKIVLLFPVFRKESIARERL
jgi:hypothetical protein